MIRILSRALPAVALLALAVPAFAQSANLAVTANVSRACRVTTAAPAITINYDVFDTSTAASSGSIDVRCTRNTTIQVAASAGANGAFGGFARSVQNGADRIGYTLALSAGGAELAPGAVTGTGVPSAGKGTDVPITLHAALDTTPGADPAPGAYTDTVVVTFTAL